MAVREKLSGNASIDTIFLPQTELEEPPSSKSELLRLIESCPALQARLKEITQAAKDAIENGVPTLYLSLNQFISADGYGHFVSGLKAVLEHRRSSETRLTHGEYLRLLEPVVLSLIQKTGFDDTSGEVRYMTLLTDSVFDKGYLVFKQTERGLQIVLELAARQQQNAKISQIITVEQVDSEEIHCTVAFQNYAIHSSGLAQIANLFDLHPIN